MVFQEPGIQELFAPNRPKVVKHIKQDKGFYRVSKAKVIQDARLADV